MTTDFSKHLQFPSGCQGAVMSWKALEPNVFRARWSSRQFLQFIQLWNIISSPQTGTQPASGLFLPIEILPCLWLLVGVRWFGRYCMMCVLVRNHDKSETWDKWNIGTWLHLGSDHPSGVSQLLYLLQVPTTNNIQHMKLWWRVTTNKWQLEEWFKQQEPRWSCQF